MRLGRHRLDPKRSSRRLPFAALDGLGAGRHAHQRQCDDSNTNIVMVRAVTHALSDLARDDQQTVYDNQKNVSEDSGLEVKFLIIEVFPRLKAGDSSSTKVD